MAYSLADMKILGLFMGNDGIAASGSVSGLYDLTNSFMMGMTNGFGVITAMHYGSGNMEKTRHNFAVSISLACIIAIIVSGICLLFFNPILDILNVPVEVRESAASYIGIMISGLIFSALYNCLAASLRAVGDAYTPLVFLVISTLLNTGLDILFVGGFKLGTPGAAIATVTSQIICSGACLSYSFIRYKDLRFRLKELIPHRKTGLRMLLSSGISMALMSSMVAFGTLSLQTAINTLGENIVVAHAATRKLSGIFMLPFGVFGTAMATYSGQNYGAGKTDRIREGLKVTLGISFSYSVICMIVSHTVCPSIISAIASTDDAEIIFNAVRYQKIDTLFYFVPAVISIFRNSLQGMGEHRLPVISSFAELLGKLLIALYLTPVLKYMGIILAEPIVWIIMVIPLIYGMYKKLRTEKSLS
ncbi:MAG: MATE family efflux transporter [Lachnospiraceae bacterium]|nr:MATE family efflux transporter [Lachnospiraceae bacterium]